MKIIKFRIAQQELQVSQENKNLFFLKLSFQKLTLQTCRFFQNSFSEYILEVQAALVIRGLFICEFAYSQ
jgi:hypothetical protein